MTTQMFSGFSFEFLAPVKASPTPAPRKFTIATVRSLLMSESRKRQGAELGKGQAMQAAAEFVAKVVLKNYRQSPEFESMMGACLLHMEDGYLMRPDTTAAEAKKAAADRMARIEGKPSAPPPKPAPIVPMASPKFSVDKVTSLMRQTQDTEAQALALVKRVSGDSRYTQGERDGIVDAIRAGLIVQAMKRGSTFADAERAANAVCSVSKFEARRPRPKPAQGAPEHKATRRGEKPATVKAAPEASKPTDAVETVREDDLLKAIDSLFEKMASQPPPPAGSSITGRSADEIAAYHARVKAQADAKAERRRLQQEAEAKAGQGRAAAEAKAEAERKWRSDMKAKAEAEAQSKKNKKAQRGAHAQAS